MRTTLATCLMLTTFGCATQGTVTLKEFEVYKAQRAEEEKKQNETLNRTYSGLVVNTAFLREFIKREPKAKEALEVIQKEAEKKPTESAPAAEEKK